MRHMERCEHTNRYLQFYLIWVNFTDKFDSFPVHTNNCYNNRYELMINNNK